MNEPKIGDKIYVTKRGKLFKTTNIVKVTPKQIVLPHDIRLKKHPDPNCGMPPIGHGVSSYHYYLSTPETDIQFETTKTT